MRRLGIVFSLMIVIQSFAQTKNQVLDFNLSLDQLSELRMKADLAAFEIHPGLELTLEELNEIQIHKVIKESSVISIEYDLSLEELSELTLAANSNNIQPAFDTSLNTLSKLSLKKEFQIDSQISVPFGLPIETLAKLSLVD